MSKDLKRKRDSDNANEADQPRTKIRNDVDQTTASVPSAKPVKKGSDRRQLRSERKKKRQVQAQKNAQRKKEAKAANVTNATTTNVRTESAVDDLAEGTDFVSLAPTDTAPTNKFKKGKGRSPRSIRKEARQKKIDEKLAQDAAQGIVSKPDKKAQHEEDTQPTKFICFIGNLPYTATTTEIAAHFSKLTPKAIRLSTDKKTGKSKGFAFLEFENFDKMKTCLKLYHHSIFNPEANNQKGEVSEELKAKGRKINVELTAGGGGGKSLSRKDKIKAKNKKLNEERARERTRKQQEKQHQQGTASTEGIVSGSAIEQATDAVNDSRGDIHPSRMSRVKR